LKGGRERWKGGRGRERERETEGEGERGKVSEVRGGKGERERGFFI
jgi:hypothetical protein